MNGRTRIGCGLLAGVVACLLAPSAATRPTARLPGSAGTGMNEVLDVQGDIAATRTGGYLQIPFTVPPGRRHPGPLLLRPARATRAAAATPNTLDMGVYQPKANPSSPVYEQTDRRGWSGSAVKNLAIAENGFTDDTTYNADKKAFVNGFTTRAYQPGPDPGRRLGGRARDRLRRPRRHRRHPLPRAGPDEHRSVLEQRPVHPERAAGRRHRSARARLVHGRPPRPRRAGARQRDDDRHASPPPSAPAAPGSTSSRSSTTTTTSPTTT